MKITKAGIGFGKKVQVKQFEPTDASHFVEFELEEGESLKEVREKVYKDVKDFVETKIALELRTVDAKKEIAKKEEVDTAIDLGQEGEEFLGN